MSSILTYPFDRELFNLRVQKNLRPLGIDITSLIQDHSISESKLRDYLSRIEDEGMRQATITILKGVKHVSWPTFSKRFLQCARAMRGVIEARDEIARSSSFLGVSSVNSLNFFASYALFYAFKDAPFHIECGMNSRNIPRISNFIYCDDACYSGSQLYSFLNNVYKALSRSFFARESSAATKFTMFESNGVPEDIRTKVAGGYALLYDAISGTFYFYGLSTRRAFGSLIALYKYAVVWTASNASVPQVVNLTEKQLFIMDEVVENFARGIHVYVCIPFVSRFAFRKINELQYVFNLINAKIKFVEFESYSINDIIRAIDKRDERLNVEKLMEQLYVWHPSQVAALFPMYFDHKVASIVSTLSLLLNCGMYFEKDGTMRSYGSILNNCEASPTETEDILKLIAENYNGRVAPSNVVINTVCSYCPKPVYKFTEKDIADRIGLTDDML